MAVLPTAWIVDTDALNGRTGPSTRSPIKLDAKRRKIILHRGDKVWARREVRGDGRTWLVTRFGTYYAKDFCRRPSSVKAAGGTGVRINPVPGHPVTTPWGKKPRNNTYWRARGHHTGSDRAAPSGTPVVAMLSGKVTHVHNSVLGNIALLYTRDKAGRKVTFWFCHLSAYGASGRVKAGDRIGRVGMTGTGAAMGPHLHLEVRLGWTTSWAGRDFNPEGEW